jgi:hypothetical protein
MSQHTAARVAGFLYLFTNITAIFAFYTRGQLRVRGDAVQTAANIAGSERLFRIGTVTELITVAGVIMLVAALYVVVRPVNRDVAILAAFWRLAENCVLAVATLHASAALALLSGADYLRVVDTQQLQALAYTFLRVHGTGYNVGFVFLGLGSTAFSYLLWKSRYIPRALAALGIVASSVLAVVTLAIMIFPGLAAVLSLAHMAPMGVYEFTLGFWLLVKGIRTPAVEC